MRGGGAERGQAPTGRGGGRRGPPQQSTLDTLEIELARERLKFWRLFAWLRRSAQKLLIWGAFGFVLWLLRDFFALIFVTFVFSFVSASLARLLGRPLPSLGWKPRVALVYAGFLAAWALVGFSLLPQVKAGAVALRQVAADFPTRWRQTIEPTLLAESPWYRSLLEYLEPMPGKAPGTGNDDARAGAPATNVEPADLGIGAERSGLLELPVVRSGIEKATGWLVEHSPAFISGAFGFAGHILSVILLSTLFSLLILLDLKTLQREVTKLENTKISGFYRETGRNIVKFAGVLGQVLEAQAIIALANTVLTCVGLYFFLGTPHVVAFLSLVVFICGFIPVAGVFISSVPICLVGLYEGNLLVCAGLVAFITGIHFVEAYVLNPRIMGAALKVNPVLTLVVLVVGHHALGVWGLLLGLPIAYYFFTHVIKAEEPVVRLFSRRRQAAATPPPPAARPRFPQPPASPPEPPPVAAPGPGSR